MAIKSFADQTAADIFHGVNSKASRRVPRTAWASAQRKMTLIHTATKLEDIAGLPGLRFEPMKHDRPGFYGIRVNDDYRIFFAFQNGDAFNVSIENYHGRRTS